MGFMSNLLKPKTKRGPREPKHARSKQVRICDVCAKTLQAQEGYLLTTEMVVSTPAYWDKCLPNIMSSSLGAGWKSHPMMLVKMTEVQMAAASQSTPWMVCDECIGLFAVDKNQCRQWALQWYQSEGTFTPPGNGAVPVTKVNIT